MKEQFVDYLHLLPSASSEPTRLKVYTHANASMLLMTMLTCRNLAGRIFTMFAVID